METFFNTLFRTFYRDPKPHRIFFMKTENILDTEADKTGLIIDIQHDNKYKFEEIKLIEKPIIETIQKGMSSVNQDLILKYSNTIVLEGKEADTFFNIDFELALKIIDSHN